MLPSTRMSMLLRSLRVQSTASRAQRCYMVHSSQTISRACCNQFPERSIDSGKFQKVTITVTDTVALVSCYYIHMLIKMGDGWVGVRGVGKDGGWSVRGVAMVVVGAVGRVGQGISNYSSLQEVPTYESSA